MVRPQTANLPFIGSIPIGASKKTPVEYGRGLFFVGIGPNGEIPLTGSLPNPGPTQTNPNQPREAGSGMKKPQGIRAWG